MKPSFTGDDGRVWCGSSLAIVQLKVWDRVALSLSSPPLISATKSSWRENVILTGSSGVNYKPEIWILLFFCLMFEFLSKS